MTNRLFPLAVLLPFVLAGCTGGETGPEPPRAPVSYEAVQNAVWQLSGRFPEATDTAVRDRVLVAVYCSVIHSRRVPTDFEMFSPAGDQAVRAVVLDFVQRARAETAGLSDAQRIRLLWGDAWRRDLYVRRSDCRGL